MPLIDLCDIANPELRFGGNPDPTASLVADSALASQLAVYEHRRDALLLDWPGTEHGVFIGESANVIERAMDAGLAPMSFFLERKWLERTMPLIERAWKLDQGIPVFVGTHEQFRTVTTYEITRGALAAFARPALPDVRELLASARRVAVLEDIRNFTNIGAIFRSAAALGVDAVLVTPNCHDPYYRRAARVSMGTVFQVPWTRIGEAGASASSGADPDAGAGPAAGTNANHASTNSGSSSNKTPNKSASTWATTGIPLLHELGFSVAALALSDEAIPLDSKELRNVGRLALVLGTESDGLSPITIAACDYVVTIPMEHGVDSLNVAAASAVAFWETRRR